MSISNEELRKLAKAATQGEWDSFSTAVYLPLNAGGFDIRNSPNAPNNAAFIAAASPAKVKELLDQIDALKKEVKSLNSALDDCYP